MKNLFHGQGLLIRDAIIPVKLEQIADAAVIVDENTGRKTKTLGAFKAVGSVADAIYQSGRVIPKDVQTSALTDATESKRQMTMFLGHPQKTEVDENQLHIGRPDHIAGQITKFHFDAKTKHTELDRVVVFDTNKGRETKEIIDTGMEMGVSQRAVGKQEIKDFPDENGNDQKVLMVTDLFGIFGWDMLVLSDANAGAVTAVKPLNDSALGLLMGTSESPSGEGQTLWGASANLQTGVYEVRAIDSATEFGGSSDDTKPDETALVTDEEINEFALFGDDKEIIEDRAVGVHSPAKADVKRPWSPSTAEVNRLPNSGFAFIQEAFLKGRHRDVRKGRKMPHHLPDGRTVFRGVKAAMAVLNGARGGVAIPASARQGVYNHLAAHYRQFDVTPPPLRKISELNTDAQNRIRGATDSAVPEEFEMTATNNKNPDGTDKTPTGDTTVEPGQPTPTQITDAAKAEAMEQGAKLVEANQKLSKTITDAVGMMKVKLTAMGVVEKEDSKKITDGLADKLTAQEAQQALSNRVFRTLHLAGEEVDDILSSDSSAADKNSKLTKLGSEMQQVFTDFTNAFVTAHKLTNDNTGDENTDDSAAATGDAGKAAETAAAATTDNAAGAEGAAAATTETAAAATTETAAAATTDGQTKPADGQTINDGGTYVPPKTGDTGKAAASTDSVETKISATTQLRDSLSTLVSGMKTQQENQEKLDKLRGYAAEAVKRQNLTDSVKEPLEALVLRGVTLESTEEAIEDSVKDSLKLINSGRAQERLQAVGFTPKGDGAMRVEDINEVHSLGSEKLSGVKLLTDSMVDTKKFKQRYEEAKKVPRDLQQLLDRYDARFAVDLAREKRLLDEVRDAAPKDAQGQPILDQSQAADFDTPATIARIILFEVYAADIIREVTDFGMMDNHRDEVPITRWRRQEGSSLVGSFRPSVLQRSNIKTGELQAIPQGKLTTEFFPIDSVARKLQATMSDEFLTRAKRRPDISGVAIAVDNLVKDVRRAIMQDIFFEHIRSGLAHGGTTFDVEANGTGSLTVFQVIGTTAANAVSIVPNDPLTPLVVEVGTTSGNRTAVPEFGTSTVGGGTGNAFFYVVTHALSLISFVDVTGAALAPASGTDNVHFTGTQADAETRFDLTLPSGLTQEQHMQNLQFEIANKRASLSSGGISTVGFYDADMLLASVVTSELLKQAKLYGNQDTRKGFSADAVITEGNYGISAGLGHWGSKVFPDDFIIVGDSNGVLFRQYEPMNLRGPIEARDSSGNLISGKEWYSYQEDSLATPLIEKFAALTLFRS